MTLPSYVGGAFDTIGSSTTVTYTLNFSATGVQDGDVVLFLSNADASNCTWDLATYNPEVWTLVAGPFALGSRAGVVYGRVWHTGDAKVVNYRKSVAAADGPTAVVFRGVDWANRAVGTGKARSAAPADTSTQTTALSLTTTRADTKVLSLLFEATSAAETGAFLTGPTMASGWTQDYYRAQDAVINTVCVAHRDLASIGASGNATFTYQNPQATNAYGLQLALPGFSAATPPTANFTSSTDDLTVTFTDTSTAGSNPITGRTWDFGDGSTSTATNPKHFYGSPGTYSVKLTVTDGATPNTKTQSITIDGVSAWYWDGAAWHEEHITKWDGTTEKGTSEAVVLANVGRNWPTAKADMSRPLDAVHRGGSSNYVEHSPIAYQAVAMRWPDKAMEVSLQWSADGHPWLSHDAYLDRMVLQNPSGTTLPVASLSDAQLATYAATAWQTDNPNVPTQPLMPFVPIAGIANVSWMELYGQKRVAFVEDKTYTHTAALIAILNANGGPSWYVWKQSGTGTLFAAVTAAGYDSWGYFFDADMPNFTAKQAQWTFVGMDYNSSDATLDPAIALAGANRVIMHIISTAAQATRLRGKGVRGLMISSPRVVAPTF